MPSLGLTGAAIPGMKYGVPRLVNGLVRDLFLEDAAHHYHDLAAFRVPELETLESMADWIGGLGGTALADVGPISGMIKLPKRKRRAR
jgi:hypothetical protein